MNPPWTLAKLCACLVRSPTLSVPRFFSSVSPLWGLNKTMQGESPAETLATVNSKCFYSHYKSSWSHIIFIYAHSLPDLVCMQNQWFFFKYFHNHGTWPSRSLLSNLFFLKNIILEDLVSCVASKAPLTAFKGEAPQYPPAFLVHLLLFLFLFPSLYYLPQAPGVAGRSRFLTTIHSSRTHLAV